MAREKPAIRPAAIIITLILMGISTLFAGVCAAYLYTLFSTRIEAPRPSVFFLINIPVLLGATIALRKSHVAFQLLHFKDMLYKTAVCLILTMVFTVFQILGWTELFRHIPMNASQSRSFLFVLSGLHLLHVIAGIPFLVRFMWINKNDYTRLQHPMEDLRSFLKGLVRYWNFLDILWILLVMILTLGYALKWL